MDQSVVDRVSPDGASWGSGEEYGEGDAGVNKGGAKIVRLAPKVDEPPVKLVESDWKECRHHRFEVHKDHPVVFCRDCDAQLDPIFVLRRVAGEHSSRTWRVAEMKREADRLEKQARRQQETRRNPHRAETDALHIQQYQAIKTRPATEFPGDVALTDKSCGE